MNNLYKRSFLRLIDFLPNEINQFLILANYLKRQRFLKKEISYLHGKNIALIFDKYSTRTRCSSEIAAFNQGANVSFLGKIENTINYEESIEDYARTLGSIYNGIQYRGFYQEIIEKLAQYSGIPVWNGLTNEFHPIQILADLLTMQEQLSFVSFNKMKLAYIGNAKNNISNSILEAAALTGFDLRIIAPDIYWPEYNLFKKCKFMAKNNGGNIILTKDISLGIKNVDFIYTDKWVSKGEDITIWKERINFLRDYQVNKFLLSKTNNKNVKFLHCLPALHNDKTVTGKKIMEKFNLQNGIEVTDDVFESPNSIVFQQAANKLHVTKAVMVATLTKVSILNENN